jgi:hypothetical protein
MIAGTLTSHMANLLAQTAASIKANATQINVSLQKLASNNAQLHQQQQSLMQQMTMLTTNATTACSNAYVPPNASIYAPSPLQRFQSSSSPPILLRVVDAVVDVVVEDIPVVIVAAEVVAPLCPPQSCMLAVLASSHTSLLANNHLFNNLHPAFPTP